MVDMHSPEKDESDELLDLVDNNDRVIGTIRHGDSPELVNSKEGLVRGVGAFIQNSKGQLWIPIRTDDKKIAPGGLDYSVSGHVRSGETYAAALVREFAEETNQSIQESDLTWLGKVPPIPENPYFFTGVFSYRSDSVPDYNTSDFKSCEWMYPDELEQYLKQGRPAKHALLPSIKLITHI